MYLFVVFSARVRASGFGMLFQVVSGLALRSYRYSRAAVGLVGKDGRFYIVLFRAATVCGIRAVYLFFCGFYGFNGMFFAYQYFSQSCKPS